MDWIVCSDLESVFIPETWISIANKLGIDELKKTTRDTPDYDSLMRMRLSVLDKHGINFSTILKIINDEKPYDGAKEFISWIREQMPFIIVSDIFKELADPFMKKLAMPTLFCNNLEVVGDRIVGYSLRQMGGKRMVALAMKTINYKVIAFGDSYNDVNMIMEADFGFFFNPSKQLREKYPDIPVAKDFDQAKELIMGCLKQNK